MNETSIHKFKYLLYQPFESRLFLGTFFFLSLCSTCMFDTGLTVDFSGLLVLCFVHF